MAERFHPLRRAAVGKAFGNDPALRLLLQRVVADRLGGAHSLFDVALLESAGARCPDTGIAIGLKLDPDLDLVAFRIADALGVRIEDVFQWTRPA